MALANVEHLIIIEDYGIEELTVNEQNPQAVEFYKHLGFETYKRSEREDPKAAGIVQGISEGRKELLEELVKKKLLKNKTPEKIAEELEEDISTIQNIIEKIM